MTIRYLLVLLIISGHIQGQDTSSDSAKTNPNRVYIMAGIHGTFWTGTLIALDRAWYAQYPRSRFHFFDDSGEWQQMDKLGHLTSAYQLSRISADSWRWSGMDPRQAAWAGSISGMAYLGIIEILDGFSNQWGFSMTDLAANTLGSTLFLTQELAWQQQRILVKTSFSGTDYPTDIRDRAYDLFGQTALERWLKDYNNQTYWLSINLRSFYPDSPIPTWLNVAVGHGARMMLGGRGNSWTDPNSGLPINRSDLARYRRLFLSLDIDLTKIRTRNKTLKTIFSLVNILKIPAPALEFDTRGTWKFHGLYF